jgi:hypothetical protein
VLKLADKPSGLEGGGNGIKSSLFGDLTAPWRFEPSLYSKARKDDPSFFRKMKTHCRVLKLADKPSGLGGGEFGRNSESDPSSRR